MAVTPSRTRASTSRLTSCSNCFFGVMSSSSLNPQTSRQPAFATLATIHLRQTCTSGYWFAPEKRTFDVAVAEVRNDEDCHKDAQDVVGIWCKTKAEGATSGRLWPKEARFRCSAECSHRPKLYQLGAAPTFAGADRHETLPTLLGL